MGVCLWTEQGLSLWSSLLYGLQLLAVIEQSGSAESE